MSAQPSTLKQVTGAGCLLVVGLLLLTCSGCLLWPKSEEAQAKAAAETMAIEILERDHGFNSGPSMLSYTSDVEEVNPDVWRIYGRIVNSAVGPNKTEYHYVAIIERTSDGDWRPREPISVVKQ